MQDCGNSIANTQGFPQSSTKPSVLSLFTFDNCLWNIHTMRRPDVEPLTIQFQPQQKTVCIWWTYIYGVVIFLFESQFRLTFYMKGCLCRSGQYLMWTTYLLNRTSLLCAPERLLHLPLKPIWQNSFKERMPLLYMMFTKGNGSVGYIEWGIISEIYISRAHASHGDCLSPWNLS